MSLNSRDIEFFPIVNSETLPSRDLMFPLCFDYVQLGKRSETNGHARSAQFALADGGFFSGDFFL
jgi:hypothetical protein